MRYILISDGFKLLTKQFLIKIECMSLKIENLFTLKNLILSKKITLQKKLLTKVSRNMGKYLIPAP